MRDPGPVPGGLRLGGRAVVLPGFPAPGPALGSHRGESALVEPVGHRHDRRPPGVALGLGAGLGDPAAQRQGREGHGDGVEQALGRHPAAPPFRAFLAADDVPGEAPPQLLRERALDGVEQRGQIGAVRAAGPGEDDRRGGVLQVVAGAGETGAGLPRGEAEHGPDLRDGELVPQREEQDVPLLVPQLRQALAHDRRELRILLVPFQEQLRRGAVRGGAPAPGGALETRQRVQPGTRARRLAQRSCAAVGGDERVVHGVRGGVGVVEQ